MNDILIDLNVLVAESAEAYHAKASEFLSSHQLIDFMKCPWLHYKKSAGLIEDQESPAYLVGRAVHVRVLEGRDSYEQEFAIGGPITPSTGRPYGPTSKVFKQWAQDHHKCVLTADQAEMVECIASGISMNSEAIDLLLYGRAEGTVRSDYCSVQCQARFDWVHPHRGLIDLKTCDDLTWFEADARRWGYHWQLAFYQSTLETMHLCSSRPARSRG